MKIASAAFFCLRRHLLAPTLKNIGILAALPCKASKIKEVATMIHTPASIPTSDLQVMLRGYCHCARVVGVVVVRGAAKEGCWTGCPAKLSDGGETTVKQPGRVEMGRVVSSDVL
ncbi:hypothetical protein NC653_030105 [Populus alba x Populus x berolinensis]|uniref:Uncharacterized protein n=1 Tax=Populus alba x Populus x berolinensis TaxID=444605 RepID=A0AAD6Q1P5_9ROSI|nr:hypothetical protein NC653_030105 [Populus alba x Populus x berolinensis]